MNKTSKSLPTIAYGFLVSSDKQRIAFTHYKNNHDAVVVIVHGFYNSKDASLLTALAQELIDRYDVFMFDFRGHGKSQGLYTWSSREGRDLHAALDHLRGRYQKTALISFSLGSSIAINTLSRRSAVDSLICVSAVSEFAKIDYQFWKLDVKHDLVYTLFTRDGRRGRGFRPGPFWSKKDKAIDAVDKITIPVLYIHGDKDWVVKPWHSQALYKKTQSRKKLVLIKNGTHAEYLLKDTPKPVLFEIRQWLASTL